MNPISLKPDKKLLSKQLLNLFLLSVYAIIIGLILQISIPLGGKTTHAQVAAVLWPIIGGLIILMCVISIPLLILWVKNLEYFIEEERITIHKGILTKIQQNIPYRAITDFQLHRSLFDRLLGIGSVRIQTAGQSQTPTGYEGNLAGLTDWDTLISELRDRVKKFHRDSSYKHDEKPGEVFGGDDKLSAILSELTRVREILERKQ